MAIDVPPSLAEEDDEDKATTMVLPIDPQAREGGSVAGRPVVGGCATRRRTEGAGAGEVRRNCKKKQQKSPPQPKKQHKDRRDRDRNPPPHSNYY